MDNHRLHDSPSGWNGGASLFTLLLKLFDFLATGRTDFHPADVPCTAVVVCRGCVIGIDNEDEVVGV